jgi:hypothetical protein
VTIRIMSDSNVTPVAGTCFKLRFFIAVQSRFSESRLFEFPCRLSLYLKGVLCVLKDSDGFDFFQSRLIVCNLLFFCRCADVHIDIPLSCYLYRTY